MTTSFLGWAEEVAEDLPREVARGYRNAVEDELAPWTDGVGLGPLSRAPDEGTDLQRYRWRQGRLWRVRSRDSGAGGWVERGRQEFEAMLLRLFRQAPPGVAIPDLDLVYHVGDYPRPGFPVFAQWVREGDHNPRFPTSAHWSLEGDGGVEDDRVRAFRYFSQAALARPFEGRENRVVWRGSGTGFYEVDSLRDRLWSRFGRRPGRGRTRLDLCHLASRHPEIDAAITHWPQSSESTIRLLERHYRTTPFVDRDWFLRHRYIINVDGNVATWSFLTFVGSGSAVLSQETPYREFCTRFMEPGRDFLAFASDLSDLPELARTMLADPERGRAVAVAGRAFAERWLTGRAVDYYLIRLLGRYAELLDDEVFEVDPPGDVVGTL